MTAERPERVRVGISTCLLGENVRYDGGHKRDAFLVERFGRYVEWVPVCPEVEAGMSAPRDFLRLVEVDGALRMIAPTTDTDHTDNMHRFSKERIRQLEAMSLSGYVFKRSSPSCGVERVKIYGGKQPLKKGRGLFAAAMIDANPTLPVEEEGRLNDPRLRENFVSRVFAYHRWSSIERMTRGALVAFHAAHKFVLLAHNQDGMRRLGGMIGRAGDYPSTRALADAYWTDFSRVMARTPTRRNHTNVLQHIAGFISDQLDTHDRAELAEAIESYRLELLPLIVPITLLRHYVRKFGPPYLEGQVYLDPHPDELMLLNQL
jgi:uncharacterized protein YbgA (DUF1722 family)/uncharacterized protein YbbK (DUF523 family)